MKKKYDALRNEYEEKKKNISKDLQNFDAITNQYEKDISYWNNR